MITLHGEEVKVGDKVWHWFRGWVIVTDGKSSDALPISFCSQEIVDKIAYELGGRKP